jgi:ATP-dependent helicase/DNAse subunit B
MPARVTILCGPARCGKTERLLTRYRTVLSGRPPGAVLWLAPTWRAASEIRERLLDGDLPGCFQPGVMTFEKFAEAVLHAAELPIRPMTRLMKRELVRQIISEQSSRGRLRHFQPIAGSSGLVDLVCEFISELKRLEIWPDEFRRACQARGLAEKDTELSEIYDLYQNALREHGLFDAEGRFWSARDVLAKGKGREERGEGRGLGTSVPSGVGSGQSAVGSEEGGVSQSAISNQQSAIPSPLSPLPSPLLVVADGFTDFTRTQHEILEILAAQAEEMFVTLLLEPEPRREDLFAKPLKTLDELRRRHSGAKVEQLARTACDWPALAQLEGTIFENPRQRNTGRGLGTSVPSRAASIEILAAARQVGEIEMIARRIKRLLVDGEARPGEIAVVFRSPRDSSELVDEVFGRLGIPVKQEAGKTLDHSPALRWLVALLQLDLDDWPFDRLLAVLRSNYFQPKWPEWCEAKVDVERAIRGLQVPRKRELLIEELGSNGYASNVVRRLAAAFDALPERATLPDWGEAWRRLASATGLLGAIYDNRNTADDAARRTSSPAKHQDSDVSLFDRRAWERLMKALGEGEALAAWLKRRPPELDRRAAVEALVDILGSDRIGSTGDEAGYVRMLSAESVRSLQIPYVFLARLSEKAFPAPDREDRLYSEAEQVRLIDAGLPLVARSERTREEMLLFYEAATRATKRLYLSYPALDESAQPLLPSPFLNEVEEAFGAGSIPRSEQKDLSPIPPEDELFCQFDFRVKAVATALAGNVALLAGLMRGEGTGLGTSVPSEVGRGQWVVGSGQLAVGSEESRSSQSAIDERQSAIPLPSPLSPLPPLAAGLELIYQRQGRDQFGPAEGMLQSAAASAALAGQFDLQHTFSATELERYASCPFRFFLERILKIEPLEDLALEFDVLERGRVVHDVLSQFHRKANERLGRPGSPLELDPADFKMLLDAAIRDSLPREPRNPVQAALREVDRRLVVEWLSHYRQQIEKYDSLWTDFSDPMAAELFEVSFGRSGEPAPSTDEPLKFTGEKETVRVSGRIDRIDTGVFAGQSVFNVLDYKTGRSIRLTPESIAAGTTLQLPLYAIAAMELMLNDRDAWPWRAGYWYLRDDGFKPRQALKMYDDIDGRIELDPQWEEIRAGLSNTVIGLVCAMRAGQFPVCSGDEHCTGHCPFRTVCRINQVRSLEKTWQPS